MELIQRGKYRHFKGGIYTVVGIVWSADDGLPRVLYEDVCGKKWCRHIADFQALVPPADPGRDSSERVPRFEFIGDEG